MVIERMTEIMNERKRATEVLQRSDVRCRTSTLIKTSWIFVAELATQTTLSGCDRRSRLSAHSFTRCRFPVYGLRRTQPCYRTGSRIVALLAEAS